MIKLLLVGIWVCCVTLASSYAAVSWQRTRAARAVVEKPSDTLASIRTRMISVPIVADGALHGYVMAQFVVTMDAKTANHPTIKPDLYILDEAFKTIYSEETIDFRRYKKQDISKLSEKIVQNVNKRFGAGFIQDVLIQELNFIAKDEARNMRKSGPQK